MLVEAQATASNRETAFLGLDWVPLVMIDKSNRSRTDGRPILVCTKKIPELEARNYWRNRKSIVVAARME